MVSNVVDKPYLPYATRVDFFFFFFFPTAWWPAEGREAVLESLVRDGSRLSGPGGCAYDFSELESKTDLRHVMGQVTGSKSTRRELLGSIIWSSSIPGVWRALGVPDGSIHQRLVQQPLRPSPRICHFPRSRMVMIC